MTVRWMWTAEELADQAKLPNWRVEILRLLESGEMTNEQHAALDEYLKRGEAMRCPECGR